MINNFKEKTTILSKYIFFKSSFLQKLVFVFSVSMEKPNIKIYEIAQLQLSL